ncbi:hypothetical protein GIB67_024079 [Kingdonia uniflora]|uniref:Chromatin assembly factor 1 subunit FAS1 n=1 Tax=Kingdonia uniflora TaxID=39325 RepID=A0A7J7MMF1_9MAGN|nr:hypothetical protein GIB67_024079 [Kingdonia uniflora]
MENKGVQSDKQRTKYLKRKRVSSSGVEKLSVEERESRVDGLNREIETLIQYFKEVSSRKVDLNAGETECSPSLVNSVVARLLEESDLPYSKLVAEIFDTLKSRREGITVGFVQSSVLFVGQRSMYGVCKADADVLEDTSESCLWCWETRDLKLIPKVQRGVLSIRRTCRKKIQERINAVSTMKAALHAPESHPSFTLDLMKASEKLVKVLKEAEIRELVDSMAQKNSADMAGKESKLNEKEVIKEIERNKREVEKEKKRLDREHQKEKLQNEKELKRLQEEAEKEERRREKEEAEKKKQLKRQQDEAEKEQRRREKEESELKKQLALQKQATIMERFLKSKKSNSNSKDDQSSMKPVTSDSIVKGDGRRLSAVTLAMDYAISLKGSRDTNALRRLHMDSWIKSGLSSRSGRCMHWGMRHKPKTVLIKELKLQGSSSEVGAPVKVKAANNKGVTCCDEIIIIDGWEEATVSDRSCNENANVPRSENRVLCNRTKKLLQFDKSHRPAYYGTLSSKSDVVKPRQPLTKDPNLDYDNDSDEEWEEEDPGESLSDSEKDPETDLLEEGSLRTEDDDGSEDGFLVPDGYLSDNEGVQVDSMHIGIADDDDVRSSPKCKQDLEGEEFRVLLRQQKYISNLTDHALQKNQPFIISNLMHEKALLLTSEGLNGTPKIEQLCLQALSIRAFPVGPPIEISIDCSTQKGEDQDVNHSQSKGSAIPKAPAADILATDLPKIVWGIQACPQGITKVVDSLQQKFPNIPKPQLNKKVREISEFVDNRWQVKKEVLAKLGLQISSEKCDGKVKGIAAFFSKRCLPPTGGGKEPIKTDGNTPQPCLQNEVIEIDRPDSLL